MDFSKQAAFEQAELKMSESSTALEAYRSCEPNWALIGYDTYDAHWAQDNVLRKIAVADQALWSDLYTERQAWINSPASNAYFAKHRLRYDEYP